MEVKKNGQTAMRFGPAQNFSGTVTAESIITAPAPARIQAARVTFLPNARTAWHSHPYGQTLYVTHGAGLVQAEGKPAFYIKPGDTVWIAPGEKHWHGATSTTPMTHIAMHERKEDQYATWMEHVSDEDYAAAQPKPE